MAEQGIENTLLKLVSILSDMVEPRILAQPEFPPNFFFLLIMMLGFVLMELTL
ncbi:MAG: hypothetical protein Q8Q40_07620 [Methylococcaceae bacterium]|nr:hypothetical protein [Methylococcaceae bacterium]MDP3903830.1 hypothetical protein [Methylococcaceae bacterium]